MMMIDHLTGSSLLPVGPLDERGRNLVPDDHDPQRKVLMQKCRSARPCSFDRGYRAHAGARSDAVPRLTVVINLNMI
jgi:hypothetical protein